MAAMAVGMDMTTAGRVIRSHAEQVAQRNRERFELQRRARRGPTPEIFFNKHIDNSRIVTLDDPERRKEMRTFAVTMSVLFALVMVFVWQHFSSIEIGYQVEAQKLQVEHLREDNRQLRLTEAQLSEPARIDVIAKQLGLGAPQPGQVVLPDGPALPNAGGAVEAKAVLMEIR